MQTAGRSTPSWTISVRLRSPPERSTLSGPAQQLGSRPTALASSTMRSAERGVGLAPAPSAGRRRGQQRVQAHAGHLDRVLQRQEQPGAGPLPGRQRRQVLPVHGDGARGHLGARAAHQRVGQGALARAVGAHDHVHLAAAHREVDAVQDLLARRPRRAGPAPRSTCSRRRSRQHHRHGVAVDLDARRRRPAGWPAASRARRSAGRRCCRGAGTRSRTPRPTPRPRTASSPRGCTRRRRRRTSSPMRTSAIRWPATSKRRASPAASSSVVQSATVSDTGAPPGRASARVETLGAPHAGGTGSPRARGPGR